MGRNRDPTMRMRYRSGYLSSSKPEREAFVSPCGLLSWVASFELRSSCCGSCPDHFFTASLTSRHSISYTTTTWNACYACATPPNDPSSHSPPSRTPCPHPSLDLHTLSPP